MKHNDKPKEPQERYLKIPYAILNIGGLGICEKVLLAYIYGFGKSGCWQSNATIAKVFFTNTRTVQRWIKRIHNYIYVKCPHGYYRTLWAKANPDVREGVEEWMEKQKSRQNKTKALRQNSRTTHDKTVALTTTNQSVEPRQNSHTIKNYIIKEIREEITAQPAPLPAKGQSSAVLQDRKTGQLKAIEQLKSRFGGAAGQHKPLSAAEFEQNRQRVKNQLIAAAP